MGFFTLSSSIISSWSGVLTSDSLHGMNALLDLLDIGHQLSLCIVSGFLKISLNIMSCLSPCSNNFVDSVFVDGDGHFLG